MKRLVVITCTAFMLVTCSGPGFELDDLKKFPSYEEVFNKAFTAHEQYVDNKWFLQLARKHDGWHVVKMDLDNNEQETYLFWSAKENKYLAFPAGVTRFKREDNVSRPDAHQAALFRIIPFYGYRNWHNDVIAQLEKAELNDTLMEALARAYETKAALLSGLSYSVDGKLVKQMSEKQQQDFIAYMNNALETYDRLYKKNPNYNTLVGNAQNKYSNQCIYAYLSLKYFGDTQKALPFLKENLYTVFLRNHAKNILTSCDTNAILVTYSDNDYYPLIYVQEKLGWRKDVAILNLSLMQLSGFIQKYKKAYQLKSTVTKNVYEKKETEYIVLSGTQDTVNMNFVIKNLEQDKTEMYLKKEADGSGYMALDGNILAFKNTPAGANFNIRLVRSYVLRNELFLWDLLYNSGPQRPVSLTAMGLWDLYIANIESKGLVYTFTYQPTDTSYRRGRVDTAATRQMLFKTFAYDWNSNPTLTEKSAAASYLMQMNELASAYESAGKKENAIEVVNGALRLFPLNTLPENFSYFILSRTLKKCGDERGALALANQYLDELEKLIPGLKGDKRQDQLNNLQSVWMFTEPEGEWIKIRQRATEIREKYAPAL